jgi:hypothetical protein
MRLAAYQFTTSGGSAESALRIWVFHASRSTMVRSTVRSGCSASKSAASCSITARGPGLDMSEMMRSVAAELLGAEARDKHGGGSQRGRAGLGDGSHGVLPGDPVHDVSFII